MVIPAVVAYVVFVIISSFSNVKLNGRYIFNPFVKALIGPIIMIIGGIVFITGGAVLSFPVVLLAFGKINAAMIAYGVFTVISVFPIFKINDMYIENIFLRVLITPIAMIMMGAIFMVIGAVLALPVVFLVI